MTIRSLINFEETAKRSLGISFHKGGEASVCSYCLVHTESNETKIIKSGGGLSPQELKLAISEFVTAGCPIHLNVTGTDILMRESFGNESLEQQLAKHFPFLQPDEVYGQQFQNGSIQFLSVVRTDALAVIKTLGIEENLCSVFLGPFAVQSVLSLVTSELLSFFSHEVLVKDGAIVSMREGESPTNDLVWVHGKNFSTRIAGLCFGQTRIRRLFVVEEYQNSSYR